MHTLKEMDLFTSVCLSYTNSSNGVPYQFLYSSQLYQTVFAVYGMFDLEANSNGEKILLKGITLRLVNYKGTINLGFSDIKPNALYEQSEGGHDVYFEVQACSKKLETYVKIEPPIEITKGNPKRIIFKRILLPMDGNRFDPNVRKDGRIEIGDDKQTVPINENQEYFDEEFQFRDGPFLGNRGLLNGMYGDSETKDITGTYDKLGIASPRCHQSNVNMFV